MLWVCDLEARHWVPRDLGTVKQAEAPDPLLVLLGRPDAPSGPGVSSCPAQEHPAIGTAHLRPVDAGPKS